MKKMFLNVFLMLSLLSASQKSAGLTIVENQLQPPYAPQPSKKNKPETEKKVTISSEDQKKIDKIYYWTGTPEKLVKYLKKTMRDPASFEYIESSYSKPKNGQFTIIMQYRGANIYGGKTVSIVSALLDLNRDGEVIRILEHYEF